MNNTANNENHGRLFKDPVPLIGKNPIKNAVEVVDMPTHCPNPDCGSANIMQKGHDMHVKTLLHLDEGQLKSITLCRPRCKCSDCGKTFYPKSLKFENNGPLTKEAADYIAKHYLDNPCLSSRGLAQELKDEFGTYSASAMDRLIRTRTSELTMLKKIIPCNKLFCLPFRYRRKQCYAIVGMTETEDKIYLMDILDDTKEKALERYFDPLRFSDNPSSLFLTDFNWNLLNRIEDIYSGRCCEVGVLGEFIARRIKTFRKMDIRSSADREKKETVLKELQKAVRDEATKHDEEAYINVLEGWESELLKKGSAALQSQVYPLYAEIMSMKRECWVGLRHAPWEREFRMLEEIIEICEWNNLSFDFMVFRLLFANHSATQAPGGDVILHCIHNFVKPVKVFASIADILNLGEPKVHTPIAAVDIRELWEEIMFEKLQLEKIWDEAT